MVIVTNVNIKCVDESGKFTGKYITFDNVILEQIYMDIHYIYGFPLGEYEIVDIFIRDITDFHGYNTFHLDIYVKFRGKVVYFRGFIEETADLDYNTYYVGRVTNEYYKKYKKMFFKK